MNCKWMIKDMLLLTIKQPFELLQSWPDGCWVLVCAGKCSGFANGEVTEHVKGQATAVQL